MNLIRQTLIGVFIAGNLALTAVFGCTAIVDGKIGPEVDAGPDCTGRGDFTDCPGFEGDRDQMCFGGVCIPSVCGDQIVDPRFEECDPEVPEPGCQNCQWVCTENADCDDGEPCNGEESCNLSTHLCVVGSIPANGSACQTATGEAGTCQSLVCTPLPT
jgi:hypothetical protein